MSESSCESLQIFSQSSFKSHYNTVILNVSSQLTERAEVSGKTHQQLERTPKSHGKSAFQHSSFLFVFSSLFACPAHYVRFIRLWDREFLWLVNLQNTIDSQIVEINLKSEDSILPQLKQVSSCSLKILP